MHDHLDLGVGEHARQRRPVEALLQRVDQLDPQAGGVVGDRELDQAQQRAVAALAHELGVERQLAAALCLRGDLGDDGVVRHQLILPRSGRRSAKHAPGCVGSNVPSSEAGRPSPSTDSGDTRCTEAG